MYTKNCKAILGLLTSANECSVRFEAFASTSIRMCFIEVLFLETRDFQVRIANKKRQMLEIQRRVHFLENRKDAVIL
jgi:hypothetical protein